MTDKELQGIKERADAATPGPWFTDEYLIKSDKAADPVFGYFSKDEDAEFCAHAREDIPKLLECIETLKSQNETIAKDKSNAMTDSVYLRNMIRTVYKRFKHLSPIFHDVDDNSDPFHRAARDLWKAVECAMEQKYEG